MEQKNKKYYSITLLLLVAVFIAYLSFQTVWLGDDIKYQYNYAHLDQRVSSFEDAIESQNYHYTHTNGRYLAHTLVQSFCGFLGQPAFAIANGLMYILFFLAIFRLCDVKLSNFKSVASIIVLGLLTFQTKMMPSCQIGFVWMFTFTMGLLILFFKSNLKPKAWLSTLSVLPAIIIGNGQEALNIGVSVALFFYWIGHRKEMTLFQYCLMIGFWIGTASDCLSPGTLNRGAGSMGVNMNRVIVSFLRYLFLLKGIWFLCIIVLYYKFKHKISWKNIYKQNSFFWVCLIALFCMNIAVHFESNRAGFGVELMAIIIGIRTIPSKSLNKLWLSLCTLLLIVNFYYQTIGILKKQAFYQEVTRQYSTSADGKVYISDWDFYSPIPYNRNFSGVIVPYGVNNGGDMSYYEYRNLAHKLTDSYPGRPYPIIMPTYLKGKEHTDLGNQLIYLGNSLWLAVQSKSDPATFEVHREFPIFPTYKTYDSVVVDMTQPECILEEGDNWRARFIYEMDYSTHDINITKEIKKVKKE
ncbi:MAG: DUF6056 family protein [Lepagella sp.]